MAPRRSFQPSSGGAGGASIDNIRSVDDEVRDLPQAPMLQVDGGGYAEGNEYIQRMAGIVTSPRLWAEGAHDEEIEQIHIWVQETNGQRSSCGYLPAASGEDDLITAFEHLMPQPTPAGNSMRIFLVRPVTRDGTTLSQERAYRIHEGHVTLRRIREEKAAVATRALPGVVPGVSGAPAGYSGGIGVFAAPGGAGMAEGLNFLRDTLQQEREAARANSERQVDERNKLAEERGRIQGDAVATIQTITERQMEAEQARVAAQQSHLTAAHEQQMKAAQAQATALIEAQRESARERALMIQEQAEQQRMAARELAERQAELSRIQLDQQAGQSSQMLQFMEMQRQAAENRARADLDQQRLAAEMERGRLERQIEADQRRQEREMERIKLESEARTRQLELELKARTDAREAELERIRAREQREWDERQVRQAREEEALATRMERDRARDKAEADERRDRMERERQEAEERAQRREMAIAAERQEAEERAQRREMAAAAEQERRATHEARMLQMQEEERKRQHEMAMTAMQLREQKDREHAERMAELARSDVRPGQSASTGSNVLGILGVTATIAQTLGFDIGDAARGIVGRLMGSGNTEEAPAGGTSIVDVINTMVKTGGALAQTAIAARAGAPMNRRLPPPPPIPVDDDEDEEEEDEDLGDDEDDEDDEPVAPVRRQPAPVPVAVVSPAPVAAAVPAAASAAASEATSTPVVVPAAPEEPKGGIGLNPNLVFLKKSRETIKALVQAIGQRPKEEWSMIITNEIAKNPSIIEYLRTRGLRTAWKEAGGSMERCDELIAELEPFRPMLPPDFNWN